MGEPDVTPSGFFLALIWHSEYSVKPENPTPGHLFDRHNSKHYALLEYGAFTMLKTHQLCTTILREIFISTHGCKPDGTT
jgi:hypothetical protein